MPKVGEYPPQIYSLAAHLPKGQYKKRCPLCQGERRKHKTDRPLSLMIDGDGVKYSCHHCGAEGGWLFSAQEPFYSFNGFSTEDTKAVEDEAQAITLTAPPDDVADQARAYLMGRGIAESVIEAHTVQGNYRFNGHKVPAVGFPYRVNGDTVAIKWRSASSDKLFSQQNTCRDFFLLDDYEDGNDILICEGEMDALAWLSAGVPDNLSVMSIPNGAPQRVKDGKIDPKDDNKFQYIWRSKDRMATARRIYINADNDDAGRALAEEVGRRLDRAKLWHVDLSGSKDAADALAKHGPQFLTQALADSEPVPIMGLETAEAFCDQFQYIYENGLTTGASTGITTLDDLITVSPGMVTVVTGIPGHGKSDIVDQICMNLAMSKDWKSVYCSFEKPPELHMAQMAEKFIGKPFFEGATPRMSPSERDYSVDWMSKHFMFMDYRRGGPTTISGILDAASAAVMRMGCRILVIDPYNYLAVDRTLRETDVISDMLTTIRQWAVSHDCHVFFIAHPAKLHGDRVGKKVVVTGHDISGSAAWYSKSDFGMTVWRDLDGVEPSEVHIWKVKWSWLGRVGNTTLAFDPITSRWSDCDPEADGFDWDF